MHIARLPELDSFHGHPLLLVSSLILGEDLTDSREQQDVFLKLVFRSGEEKSDKEIVLRVEQVAKKKGVPMAHVAIGWV
jgi:aryl-alcohol dehydrogenase-like predicted oxidoreductase